MQDMICAIAELESARQPFATITPTKNSKDKDISYGIMQLLPKTAEWLFRCFPLSVICVHINNQLFNLYAEEGKLNLQPLHKRHHCMPMD